MKLFRIVTKHNITIDIQTTDDFRFVDMVNVIRVNGRFINENVSIDYDNISFFAYGDPTQQPFPHIAQTAPSTETKQ